MQNQPLRHAGAFFGGSLPNILNSKTLSARGTRCGHFHSQRSVVKKNSERSVHIDPDDTGHQARCLHEATQISRGTDLMTPMKCLRQHLLSFAVVEHDSAASERLLRSALPACDTSTARGGGGRA